MKPILRIGALVTVGTALLCLSYFSTSYDRAAMADTEFLLGAVLLATALLTGLFGMDKPMEKKPAKAPPPAEPPAAA